MAAKKGRPSVYSKEIAKKICNAISNSEKGLRHICKSNTSFPDVATIMRWLADDSKKDFREQYARARELQADFMADKMLEIADDDSRDEIAFVGINNVQRAKVRVDTRKWLLSKLAPKKYGDKLELDAKVENSTSLDDIESIVKKINSKSK